VLNIDEIERLSVTSLGDDYWNDIVNNITTNINQLINKNLIEKLLTQHIDVDFILNIESDENMENDLNAYASQISDNRYQIVIGKKLLILLRHYSYKIIDYPLIFPEIKRNDSNKKQLNIISDAIFYYWMDFICLHEWSHIVKGHLNYKDYLNNKSQPFYEFNILQNDNNDIYLEVDADRFAGRILLGRFGLSINKLKKHIESDTETLISNFNIGMLYLFDIFHFISNENHEDSHPTPFYRMIILLTSLAEALHMNNKILDISEDKFATITQSIIFNFTLEYGKDYNLDPEKIKKDFPDFLQKYLMFIKDIKLEQYQIIKQSI